MKLIHIVGRQNNGKTTLIIDLLKELKTRGLNVGTLKHSSHVHELDKPGKDSFLHREAGGCPAAVATKNQLAVYMTRRPQENPFNHLAPLFEKTDLVLIEGYISGPGKKVEVWRKDLGTDPLVLERDDIVAVVTDDKIETDRPVWPRSDISNLADHICRLADSI
jgi:molybdopterin-guanine dinucleotide biosynthesis protein B